MSFHILTVIIDVNYQTKLQNIIILETLKFIQRLKIQDLLVQY